MTNTVDRAFEELDKDLNLDPTQRERAQKRHTAIRDELARAGIVAYSFVQGSFARKTMLKPLKDVDIVIVFKDELWEQLKGPGGPATALAWFKRIVQQRWPEAMFDQGDEPAGKALRVTFPDLDFDIDLVAAFDDTEDYVLIGDRDEKHWERSNTRRQISAISQRNQLSGGRFVHQVREFKSLVRNHEADLDFVKGIVVESLAYAVIDSEISDKHAIVACLDYSRTAVLYPVIEPAGDDDVTVKWTPAERESASAMFGRFADQAAEALRLETQDTQAAIDVWNALFGDVFPTARIRTPEEALAAWNNLGSRTSTGRPSTSTGGQQPTRPGRAWSPR